MPLLKVDSLSKHYGGVRAIDRFSYEVETGQIASIIGPNGAGKSTLFNLISGLFPPSAGRVLLRGRTISGLPPHRINRLGLSRSFQITNIFHRLSVFENLRIGVMAREGVRFNLWRPVSGLGRVNEEAEEILDRVRLAHRRDHAAGDLTYSEQRALEIGMTLATGADVILLDEPTAGMSRDEADYVVGLIREVTRGKTLLVVEHDMSVVFSLCDRISVLVYGALLATGAPDAIRNNREVQEAYLGEEAHA